MTPSNYHSILQKLDAFINKYYINLIIKGFLYLLLISISLFIVLAISEFFAHFTVSVRTLIFYSFVVVFVVVFVIFILRPVFGLLRLSGAMNHQQASIIIGKHFAGIDDKLSNILQLQELDHLSKEQHQLILASIDQKSKEISPFPILKAVNFRYNYKYLKFLLVPILVLLITWISNPNLVSEPSTRLLNYSEEFEKPQAFSIHILNKDLVCYRKDDFKLDLEVQGHELPEKLFIYYYNTRFLMNKNSGNSFSYTFKNIRQNIDFHFVDQGDFKSKDYNIITYPKAQFQSFELFITAPKYTGIPTKHIKNIGDISVAEGSQLKWVIATADCDQVFSSLADSMIILDQVKKDLFHFYDTIHKNLVYQLYASNKYMHKGDSISWMVQSIKDEFPEIRVESMKDSIHKNWLYFTGFIDDDYGFTSLNMVIEKEGEIIYMPLPFSKNTLAQPFYHYIDMDELQVEKGSDIAYYFQVVDNDGVNGPKASRSQKDFFHFNSQLEMMEERNLAADSLKDELKESLEELKSIHQEIKEFKKEIVNKDMLSWDDKKKMEELLERQQELHKKVADLNKLNENINEKSQDINQNERILDKQEQLEELFDQVMDEETKQKMEEIRKMLEEMNKENAQDVLEQMEMTAEELEEQLDRNLELFKQLEFEMRLEESIEELKKLADKQDSLAKATLESKPEQKEQLLKEQDSISKDFEKIKEELDKLDSLNKDLEDPNEFDKKEENQQAIDSLQKESKEALEKDDTDEASEKQQDAAEKMEEMAEEMQAQMDANAAEEMGEDMDALREILDHLISLSFMQESLMDSLEIMSDLDPKYNDLVRKQFAMEDKFTSVDDSLRALAKRQPMIHSFVIKELTSIFYRLNTTTDFLEKHKKNDALREQQFVMKSFNQLALMLNETLEQMQNMQQSMMQGKGGKKKNSCNKPGSGKPSSTDMKGLQKQLNEQMKALEKQMGKKGKKKGSKGSQGKGSSEQFARMAAEQARIRRMMQEYQDAMMEESGSKPGGLDDALKEMEKTEKDLVNKIINQETLKRQQNILTRLLKSEKAERQREKEKKRKSKEGINVKRGNPNQFLKYKDIKEKELNLLKTVPLDLNRYYKIKVDSYFYRFDNIDKDVEK